MFQIDVMSRIPPYEQIIEQFEQFVMRDLLRPGDKLDSVRQLSVQLSVNPNTIQKAYSEMDLRGYIRSVPGKGCFVTPEAKDIVRRGHRDKMKELREIVRNLILAGVTKEELVELINEEYNERSIAHDKG
ncbi:MAG: GntR family transcriptional regulator [Lachnospiraceae bacterium]|nr:GntR family transcriptional regulator [Lachnospiraceae bacterium]